ncbi:DUF6432 family protein [Halosegnis sp.]|uniref:DUF6432 family protein n=1 Tax=Halosegnis sp. TaxID=2864959 RepID=UPI0035D3E107
MQAKREFRDREETQVAVLDALVDKQAEGLTVFELRAAVDARIDDIEEALAALQAAGLIRVEQAGETTRIYPDEQVIPEGDDRPDPSLVDAIRERLPF